MNEILDRIGIYDFFGVLFPGIIAAVVGFYFYPESYNFFLAHIQTDTMRYFFFFIYSYLLGQLLHEIGFYVEKKWMFRKNEPQDEFLDESKKIMSYKEVQTYKNIFNNGVGGIVISSGYDTATCRLIYNYCIQFITVKKKASGYEKIQSLYGMARCLYTLFGLNTIIYAMYLCVTKQFGLHIAINCIVSLLASGLFYFRAKRYAKQRVKIVMRIFLACR